MKNKNTGEAKASPKGAKGALAMNSPKPLSRQYFGKNSRFCLVEFLGRNGDTNWFVKDAEQCDESGYSKTVFQAESKAQAVEKFGFALTMDGKITPNSRES